MANGNIVALDLNLDQNYIKGAVEEIVKSAIVQALGDPASIVKKAIDETINKKVDRDGKPSTSYSSIPFLDWLAKKTIEDTVREAMIEVVQENSSVLKKEFLSQMETKKFRDDLSAAFVNTVIKAAEATYHMPVTVQFEKLRDE